MGAGVGGCILLLLFNIMSQFRGKDCVDYFQGLSKGLKNPAVYEGKGKMLAQLVSQKMEQKILISQVTLPSETGTKKLIIPRKIVEPPQQSQEDLLKKVENEKMTLLQKMRDLSRQEDDLKTKIKANTTREKVQYKPQLPQNQKQLLKQLIRSNRKFERALAKKNQQLTQLYKERSLSQIKYSQQLQKQRRDRVRERALQNLRSLEAKSAERRQKHEESLKKFKEIQNNNYLYMKNAERDEQKRAEQAEQYEKKLQEIRQGLKINIEEIKQHQRKYEQHLEQSQARLEQKSIENSSRHHRHTKSYGNNYFSVVTKARIQEEKVAEYEKLNQGHIFKQRICKFQEKLSTEFKPKISNESKFKPMKQSLSSHALSSSEQRQKGIEYLQLAKKLRDAQKQKNRRTTQPPTINPPSYKDYTKQLKYKGYETAQTKFTSLVRHKNSLSNYENMSKAVELAAQIEAKSKLSGDGKLLSSVKNKIQLLRALE